MASSISGAGFPITLGGKQYLMSPFSDRDIDEMDNWIRSSVIEMARASLSPAATKAEREETIGCAIREARQLSFLSPEGAKMAASIDGIARVVWIACRKNHPEVKFEEIRAHITNAETIDYLMQVWDEQNRAPLVGGKKTQTGSPKARTRQTK